MSDTMDSPGTDDQLELARAAALAHAATVGLPDEQVQELSGAPLFGPVTIERDDRSVAAYRWLGGGRGGPYLQAEVDLAGRTVTVLSGDQHQDRTSTTYGVDDLRG